MEDFDKAYASAILAKALRLNNKNEAAETYQQAAIQLGAAIKDPEDKAIFDKDMQDFFAQ